MNVFLVGDRGGADRAAAVLESLRAPFLEDGAVERWVAPGGRVVAAWLAHPAERVGGVRYAAADGGRLALFAGRPIRWEGETADGCGPLDAARYLDGVPEGLDGRFAVVRAGDDGVEVVTDELGAYPVFRAGGWVSNSPEALRRVLGGAEEMSAGGTAGGELSLGALAGVLGGGWSLGGEPLWAGIERVPWRAATPEGAAAIAAACGQGFDAERAAARLVEGLRALADWPGRPSVVLVTGGRDSRLILAAARRAGFAFSARTGGAPGAPDVEVGRQVAAAAGVVHELLDPHPHGDFQRHWRAMAAVLAQSTGGTATLADAAGFPLQPLGGPLPLWHTGQGGEVARGYYGTARGDTVDHLVRRFTGGRPGRADLLSLAGRERVRQQIAAWCAAQRAAGARDEDLPDLFYLHQRMARWAAPTHAAVEPIRDSTSALWSARLLPDMLGLPAAARAREEFHRQVLARLAPELASVPYADPPRRGAAALARKAAAELRRRAAAHVSRPRQPTAGAPTHDAVPSAGTADPTAAVPTRSAVPVGGADPFPAALAEIRRAVAAAPDHAAWQVLDRPRVERLLATPPQALDAMSRQYVWRLATVFGGFLPDGPFAQ